MSDLEKEISRAAKEYKGVGPAKRKARRDLRRCGGCKKTMLKKMKEGKAVSSDPRPALSGVEGPQSPVPRLRIASVITVFNEGEEVRKTVESLKASVAGEDVELLVIVVDDGSTDGSCTGIATDDIMWIRHEEPQGVGRARNAGLLAALDAKADVVTFHDGHMRFPPAAPWPQAPSEVPQGGTKDGLSVIAALARKALESGAIVCSKARGWWDPDGTEHSFRAWGADMHYNAAYGLQPKYRIYRPRPSPLPAGEGEGEGWDRVPCPMGACYVFSAETVKKLSAPTGRLWDDVAGRWGFSEQALAVKAFLLDIPVLVSRDLGTHHHYRGTNPVPNAGVETWKNVCFSMASLLSESTFKERFHAYCEARLGPKVVKDLVAKARAGWVGQVRPVGDLSQEQDIFTFLCGRGASIEQGHLDHHWLPELSLVVKSAIENRQSKIAVLQWRPGESTLWLTERFPDAQFTCLEWNDHRFQNWLPILKAFPNVRLLHTTLEAWADPVKAGFIKPDMRFDLITIGGELQDECRVAAERLLAPGGKIVVNPTGDRLQIADEYRHESEAAVAAFLKSRQPAPPEGKVIEMSPTRPTGPMLLCEAALRCEARARPTVTVCLLNWKRPENIGPLLDCLGRQTLKPRVMLWDNSESDFGTIIHWKSGDGEMKPISAHPLISRFVKASANMGCFPRWWLAAACDTDYVCTLDDDLLLADPRVLEDAVAAHREECPEGIVGFFGFSRVPGKGYKDGRHHNGTTTGTKCDIIKGRFMLLRRELLERVPLCIPGATLWEDDIYVSLCVSGGRKDAHCIPARLGKRWKELGKQDARAAASRPGHYETRERQIETLLNYFSADRPKAG